MKGSIRVNPDILPTGNQIQNRGCEYGFISTKHELVIVGTVERLTKTMS